jgi:peptidase C25-like protein
VRLFKIGTEYLLMTCKSPDETCSMIVFLVKASRASKFAAALAIAASLAPNGQSLAQSSHPSCKPELVPRNAYQDDPICVSLQVHDQVIADNALAPSRTQPDGSCMTGFVWRQAIPSDHICVSPATRAQIKEDNRRAAETGAVSTTATSNDVTKATSDPFAGVTSPRTFLIVAPDEFMSALAPLVAHKNATAMPTLAVSIAQLTAKFPGVDDPEKIKRGIQFAHEHLATQYVMLVGDPHWFPVRFVFFRNFSRTYPNHQNEPNLPVDGVYAPSDLYYANLYHHRIIRGTDIKVLPGSFDDWDANRNGQFNEADWGLAPRADWNKPNPDNVDGFADVAVGRITARNAADVTTYVNKIIRYETQRPSGLEFTFVADGIYPNAPRHVDALLSNVRLNAPSTYLQINKPDGSGSARWITNATPAQVASKINTSVWVGYLGHGSVNSWDGRGFGPDLVKLTANNEALPIIFTDGCGTGRFAIETPFDSEYIDVTGGRHKFMPAPAADPKNPSIPAMVDTLSGRTWGANCPGCSPLPLIGPKPNPYDFDRRETNFAYPWLFSYPQGGAIAYFGEIGVMEPQMSAEFERYMLLLYAKGLRNLGAIYLQAEAEYWKHHIDDPGVADRHSVSRLFLGFLVFFGDPSLRVR